MTEPDAIPYRPKENTVNAETGPVLIVIDEVAEIAQRSATPPTAKEAADIAAFEATVRKILALTRPVTARVLADLPGAVFPDARTNQKETK